jgi:hypothetical protein
VPRRLLRLTMPLAGFIAANWCRSPVVGQQRQVLPVLAGGCMVIADAVRRVWVHFCLGGLWCCWYGD